MPNPRMVNNTYTKNDSIDIMVGHKRNDVSVQNHTDYRSALDDEVREAINEMVRRFHPQPALILIQVAR